VEDRRDSRNRRLAELDDRERAGHARRRHSEMTIFFDTGGMNFRQAIVGP
jgi:hypothetical protein